MREYLEKYRGRLLLIYLCVFLLHGARLHSGVIGIDTEDLIHLGNDFYGGWLHTGRQGLVFLKFFLGNAEFNPYFSGALTLLLFGAAVAAFFGLWDRCLGRRASVWAWGCGSLLWISHPAMAEQFYFSLQGMEICMGIGLTALALYFSFRSAQGDSVLWAAGSVCVLLLTFSVYQIFVVLYIFGTVTLLLLQALREASSGALAGGRVLLRRIIPYCAVFLAAFLLNTLITRLFFGSSDYLSNQIFWGHASLKDCFRAIAGHVVKAFTGYGSIFYQAGLGALAVADLALLLGLLSRGGGEKSGKAVTVFFYLALLATPFMMTVLLGGTPAMRSQMALPAFTGFLGYLGLWLAEDLGKARGLSMRGSLFLGLGVGLCLVSGLEQAKVTLGLYYTDRCRYEQDAALGRSVIERIEQANVREEPLPVAVVGGREFSGNNSCVTGEVIGRSFFNYDREVEPRPFWSTRRALGFLHTLGADYEQAPMERMEEVLENSANMPVWPAQGSVQEKNGIIIVKLSEME